MKIYIDILFIQYFIINYFLIELTSLFIREKAKTKNKLLSSMIASSYSIIVIIFDLKIAGGLLGRIILSTAIVLITYWPRNVGDVIKKTMMLYIVTYLLGGILSSIIYEIKNQHIAIIVSVTVCVLLILFVKEILRSIINKEELYCNIKIVVNEKLIFAKALLDTGNNLQDIVTGDTVIIINSHKIAEISEDLLKILNGIMVNIPEEFQTKIRMISYSSIGNMNDVLYGIKADSVVVYYDGKEIENKNVVVALTNNVFNDFDALISLNVIEGGYVVGDSFIAKNESKKVMG